MKLIDVDNSDELTIRTRQARSFALAFNLNRNLAGKTYRMDVAGNDGPVISFSANDGLVVNGSSVELTKTPDQMNIPTGVYAYDLVEITGNQAENVSHGAFIVVPSVTTITIPTSTD
jgi:hypothetical protein